MSAAEIAKRHWALIVLIAVAAPLLFAFNSQDRLASFGDDSASYLTLAHFFSGAAGNADAAAWAGYHSNFPPLFPLLLSLSGGATDYRVAYAVVAACAVLALPLVYRHASVALGSIHGGLAVTAFFLLMPTAWISVKGILSESLYLLLLMAALVHFEARIAAGRARSVDLLVFGTLVACATLTRMLGIALAFAYLAHLGMRSITRRQRPAAHDLLPLLPVAVLVSLWSAMKPSANVDGYGRAGRQVIAKWIAEPAGMLQTAADYFSSGWVASFTADPAVSAQAWFGILVIGALALGGVVLRTVRNRLDGWFLLLSVGILFPWVFTPDNTRRLLYPLVPLLLIGAAYFLVWATGRVVLGARAKKLVLAAVAIMAVALTLPALLLVHRKSADHALVIPGQPYAYRDITEYYTTINFELARERAQLVAATLSGLESIARVTPAGSRVMWMRPEYIGLLGHRPGVPFLFRWSAPELAAEVRRGRADYFVETWLLKTDLEGAQGDPHGDTTPYARPVFQLGPFFVLTQVDRGALESYLSAPASTPVPAK